MRRRFRFSVSDSGRASSVRVITFSTCLGFGIGIGDARGVSNDTLVLSGVCGGDDLDLVGVCGSSGSAFSGTDSSKSSISVVPLSNDSNELISAMVWRFVQSFGS